MTDESALLRLPLSPGIFADIPDMSLPQRSCEGTPNMHAWLKKLGSQEPRSRSFPSLARIPMWRPPPLPCAGSNAPPDYMHTTLPYHPHETDRVPSLPNGDLCKSMDAPGWGHNPGSELPF